jgi:hypothetical protein
MAHNLADKLSVITVYISARTTICFCLEDTWNWTSSSWHTPKHALNAERAYSATTDASFSTVVMLGRLHHDITHYRRLV